MPPDSPVAVTTETVVHRIGGGSVANLRLKAAEETLIPPGCSVLLGGAPDEVAEQMRQAFPDPRKFARLHQLAETAGTTTVAAIRAAGFDVWPDPSTKFPNHARIVHPNGIAGFSDANLVTIGAGVYRYTDSKELTMSLRRGQIVSLRDRQDHDLGRALIERIEGDLVFGQFTPGPDYPRVERLFAEYVEAANDQLLARVGELDEQISALGLRLQSVDVVGLPPIYDVQIGEGIITFRILPTADDRPASTASPMTNLPPAPARSERGRPNWDERQSRRGRLTLRPRNGLAAGATMTMTLLDGLRSHRTEFAALAAVARVQCVPCFGDLLWPGDNFDPLELGNDPSVEFIGRERMLVLMRVGDAIRYYAGTTDPYSPNNLSEMGLFLTEAAALAFAVEYLVNNQPLADIRVARERKRW